MAAVYTFRLARRPDPTSPSALRRQLAALHLDAAAEGERARAALRAKDALEKKIATLEALLAPEGA